MRQFLSLKDLASTSITEEASLGTNNAKSGTGFLHDAINNINPKNKTNNRKLFFILIYSINEVI